jgi:hypothetical protein
METNIIDYQEKIKYLESHYGKSILPLLVVENDCYPGKIPSEVLIYYKKRTSIEKLQESLLKTIERYNLFSSRLIMIDENKFALQYCTDGVVIPVLPAEDGTFDQKNLDDIKKKMGQGK